jgi:tagatose-1,6-bisphosphate aldolase
MEKMIIALAVKVYGKVYTDALKEDLPYYSEKEKREALDSLKEQAHERRLTPEERKWLLDSTTF